MALIEYSREIMPRIRALQELKDKLKEHQESVDKIAVLRDNIKVAQKELADFLVKDDDVNQLNTEIKEVSKELKQAIKSASRSSGYKPKELKEYFFARAKEEAVEKAVKKGQLFVELTEAINQ